METVRKKFLEFNCLKIVAIQRYGFLIPLLRCNPALALRARDFDALGQRASPVGNVTRM